MLLDVQMFRINGLDSNIIYVRNVDLDFLIGFIVDAPQFIDGRVADNTEQPCKKLCFGGIVGICLFPNFYKTFLKHILGQILILYHFKGDTKQGIPIIFVKKGNRLVVLLSKERNNMSLDQCAHL